MARESARELKEIQQQINAESQNSLGKTTIGEATAMFHNPSPQPAGVQQKPQARNGMMELQAGKICFLGYIGCPKKGYLSVNFQTINLL